MRLIDADAEYVAIRTAVGATATVTSRTASAVVFTMSGTTYTPAASFEFAIFR